MRSFSWTALAAGLVFVGTGTSHAQDTVRLGGTGDATVQSLVFDGHADTELVRGGGHAGSGHSGGHSAAHYGGHYGGGHYAGGHYGGARYGGAYRSYGGYGSFAYRPYGYRPYFGYGPYYGYGYGPYAYSYYNPWYYYTPSYYYPSYYVAPAYSYYVSPIAANGATVPNAVVLGSSPLTRGSLFQTPSAPPPLAPMPAPREGGETFPYDGGPGLPMPLPGDDAPNPTYQPRRPTVPLDGKLVSLPASTPRPSYPAYGQTLAHPVQAPARVASSATAATVRIQYPAFGER